ncbi:MAG: c-type cytochrome [Verrucomicrobiaceae bacterium]|nr:c-type cytochrome [Verrucomicrobiaceae bacterium]
MKTGLTLLLLPLVLWIPGASGSADLKFPSAPPTEPKDAAKTMHVLDGFEMQLIAAEPLVTDPVSLTYDEDGRAYVCEMNDYPYTDKEHHKHSQLNPTDMPIGRVRLLVDTDGDGVFDKATVFADGLSWPTGAACWKGGIFVTATPDIWYLKDTDGDGVAEVKQKVFTGFTKLNVQAVMNNPIWGLDHRIYVAGGSNGGTIERVPDSESVMPLPNGFKPVAFKRNDFSFDPSTGDVRLESGGARFGNTFDDWGNRFLCNIRNPCQHVVLPYRYLARNPYLVVPSALNDCAEAGDQLPVYRTSPPEPWREFRAKRWVSEGSTLPKSELVGAGVVTSSSGICVYRGDAYPKEYRDFAFVADVAGNLFYRLKLTPDGVTFKATQVDGNKNFCTSGDLWFRPVNFTNAPDGCLHVCDMYREVIEHPWSIPDDIHAALDLLRGRDRGRIWRLAPKVVQSFSSNHHGDGLKPRTTLLSRATTAELVALLDHPNAWHRETAQRLLFERNASDAKTELLKLSQSGEASGRMAAVSLLSRLDVLSPDELSQLLTKESHPRVKAHILSAFEPVWAWHLDHQRMPGLTDRMMRALDAWKPLTGFAQQLRMAAGQDDAVLRFQATLIAGPWCFTPGGMIWSHKQNDLLDPWMSFALLDGSTALSRSCITSIFRSSESDALAAFTGRAVASFVRAYQGGPAFLTFDLTGKFKNGWSTHPKSCAAGLLALHQSLAGKGTRIEAELLAKTPLSEREREEWLAWLKSIRSDASIAAGNAELPVADRARHISLITLGEITESAPILVTLLAPSQPAEIQLAALSALGSYREPAVADILIDAWPKLTPPLREKAVALMLSRTDRIAKLLDAIEAKKILPGQLSAASKATLQRQKNEPLASRIAKLFESGNSNRAAVISKYAAAMGLQSTHGLQPVKTSEAPNGSGDGPKPTTTLPDAARGEKIYETACMICHKHGDKGNDIGPHLGTIKAWTPEQILTNVLDPNREVSPNFALYIIETNDGRTLSGLIASETAGNMVLKLADGSQQSLLRTDIKSLSSPGISLMPEGLEAAITPQQMADLIEFLRK